MNANRLVNIIIFFLLLMNPHAVSLAEITISVEPQGSLAQMQDFFFQNGNAGFQTAGQTFIAPRGHPELTSFSVWLSDSPIFEPDPLEFSAYLMEWDGLKAQGDFLYKSPATDTFGLLHGERREFVFDEINVSLDIEKQYVFFISVSEYFDGVDSMAFPGSNTEDLYTNGHLVTLQNGSDISVFTNSNWNATNQWELAFTASFGIGEPANSAPVANAGDDQTVMDADDNGSEDVTLDGSGSSDLDGVIVSWEWTDNLGDTIPDGQISTAALSVGTHTITLTVTDDDSLTDTDMVTITVATVLEPANVIYVKVGGTGSGTSWADAFGHLQDALAYAASDGNVNEIRVAQGLYLPDRDSAHPTGSGNRNATFELLNGITVKGGYAGFGEADPDAREPDLYETILSGDLDANDVPISDAGDLKDEPTRCDNSFNVVTGSGTNATAVLEGFTITGGYANVEDWPNFITSCGGGMLNWGGSPTVRNCTFTGNLATVYGGGMCNFDESNPIVSNCKFVGNYLGRYTHGNAGGGGMAINNSSPVLDNCSFIMNKTCHSGAGIYNYWSYPTLTNCIIEDNSTFNIWGDGGGMYSCGGSPELTNCIFNGNSATDWYGGAMYNEYQCEPYLVNCTFVENTAYRDGGGIYNTDLSFAATMSNCIFWGNSDRGGTNESAQIEGGIVLVDYSCIQGWTGALGGTGNIGSNPQFVGGPQGGYYLSQLSAGQTTQSSCVDTGSHTAAALGLETFTTRTDEAGDEAMVDMGYHYCISGPVDANLSVGFDINETWMYQNLPGQSNSNLTADVLITDDPLSNSSYTYEWEIILPDDVTIAPTITAGGGFSDPCCTFAAPACNESGGISDSGQTFTVRVTVTGADYANTGSAEVQFGIALLGDANNDGVVNVADRSIINAFWRLGTAGPFTFKDCDVNSDGSVNVADRSIANAVWRGVLGQNSVSESCPFR